MIDLHFWPTPNSLKVSILFEEIKPIQEQLNPNIQINLSKLVKDNSFVNNITNNNGNINFEPTFEKKKTFKFSKIKQFNSIDTEILFIQNNDLIYFCLLYTSDAADE